MKYLLFYIIFFFVMIQNAVSQDSLSNGDWNHKYEILYNTPEADLMVRNGDIDNLGFGWPSQFDPFSGADTPVHSFPWTPDSSDPSGTDRIMVISSYNGHPPAGQDGYTYDTVRPGNSVRPITLTYDLGGLTVNSAILQIFVDDFQAPVWHAQYQVKLDGIRIPGLEVIINDLNQTGPIGRIINFQIPQEYLYLLNNDTLNLVFDDYTSGAGDGYAIDFIKLLINPSSLQNFGSVSGTITDSNTHLPLSGVRIVANDNNFDLTASDGTYAIDSVSTGFVTLQTTLDGYGSQTKTIILEKDQNKNVDFNLLSPAPVPQSHLPESEAFNVSPDDSIVVLFDVPIDTQTVNAFSFYIQSPDSSIPGLFKFDGSKIIFRPFHPFSLDTEYRVTLNTEIKNLSGIAMAQNLSWTFSTGAPTAINSMSNPVVRSFRLFPAYPNPFNPATTIRYQLTKNATVRLDILDITGKKIKNLVRQNQSAGTYSLTFNAQGLASGIYFVKLTVGHFSKTTKIILLQ